MATLEEIRNELVRRGAIEETPVIDTIGRNLGDAVTLGFGDELRGGLEYISAVNRGASGEEATQLRDRATQASRRRLEEARTDRPVISGVTSVASMLIPYTGAARLARLGLGAGRLGRAVQTARAGGNLREVARLAPLAHRANRRALYGSSAAASAAYGAGSGQTPTERLFGTGVGAAAGLGGAAVGEAAGHGLSLLTRRGLDPQARALRLLNRELEGSQPSEQDLARRLARGGMHASTARAEARRMIEAGKGGRFTPEDMVNRARFQHNRPTTPLMLETIPKASRTARAISAVGGPGESVVAQALETQRASFGRDVARQLERTFRPRGSAPGGGGTARARGEGEGIGQDNQPPPTGLQELNERLAIAQRAQNQEAYDIAYRAALTPAQQQAAARRMTGGAFKARARQSALDRAEEDLARIADDLDNAQTTGAATTTIQRLTDELADIGRARRALTSLTDGTSAPNLNTRALDYYQRGLRHLADDAGGGATEGGRNIAAVRRTFMENMRSLSPELHQAVSTARGFKALEEARDLGRSVLRPGKQDEVDQLLRRSMTTDEQNAFLVGALDAIETKLGANELSFVRQLQRNQNWRDLVMRVARSESAGRRLLDMIDDKVAQLDRFNFIRGGSQTAPIGQDIQRLTTDEAELGFLNSIIESGGDLKNPLTRLAAQAFARFRQPGISNPQVQSTLARLLTQPGTVRNAETLAAQLQAAPKSPIQTPAAQGLMRGVGLTGAGGAAQAASVSPVVAEMTGVPELMRAGEALGEGDYAEGAKGLALAGLGMVPFLRGPRLALGATAGLGATAAGAGVAQAQERRAQAPQQLEAATARVGELERDLEAFSSVDASDPDSVRRAQRALQARGLYVADDGRLGPDTARAIGEHREQVNAELEDARERLRRLEHDEIARETSAGPVVEGLREAGPLVAMGLAAGLGHFGVPGMRGLLGRSGAVRRAERQLTTRNREADALLTPGPLARGGGAAADARRRQANLNEFWRLGGAGERVPFRSAQTARGFAHRPAPAEPSTLYPPGASRLRANDIGAMAAAGGEAAFTYQMWEGAKRELAAAQAAYDSDPNRATLVRLENARNKEAWLQTMWRAGGGYVLGRGAGVLTHRYPQGRPNIPGAERERALLNRHLSRRK